jgi:beta-glucosidase/6-phospho-beta-glucosidase/beta-galactosidase
MEQQMANKINFPENFIWGSATASYPIEGAWNKHSKGESTWDRFPHTPGKIKNDDNGDPANGGADGQDQTILFSRSSPG